MNNIENGAVLWDFTKAEKNDRYVQSLMKWNPVKYANLYTTKENQNWSKTAKPENSTCTMDIDSTQRTFILNEHNGCLQDLESVQVTSCKNCTVLSQEKKKT